MDGVQSNLPNPNRDRTNHFGVFMLPVHYRQAKVTVRNINITEYDSYYYDTLVVLGTPLDEAVIENFSMVNCLGRNNYVYLAGFAKATVGNMNTPDSIFVSNVSSGSNIFLIHALTLAEFYNWKFANIEAQGNIFTFYYFSKFTKCLD